MTTNTAPEQVWLARQIGSAEWHVSDSEAAARSRPECASYIRANSATAAALLHGAWGEGRFENGADAAADDALSAGGDAQQIIEAWLKAIMEDEDASDEA